MEKTSRENHEHDGPRCKGPKLPRRVGRISWHGSTPSRDSTLPDRPAQRAPSLSRALMPLSLRPCPPSLPRGSRRVDTGAAPLEEGRGGEWAHARYRLPLTRNERSPISAPAGSRPSATPAASPVSPGPRPPTLGAEAEGDGEDGREMEGREKLGTASFGDAAVALAATASRSAFAASRSAFAFWLCCACAAASLARAAAFFSDAAAAASWRARNLASLGESGGGGGGGGGGGATSAFLPRPARSILFFSGT
mmetsp:Transcript_7460/g.24750  ORF Transcript_7460/g.24750 Transcript_7460/m.24750 type:complete len:252 (+) Transcript_7460:154-909(+)